MRIFTPGFRRCAKPILRPLLAGTMAAFLCTAAVRAQQPAPQQGEDPVAMKNDIQQLKAQQQQILDRLDELKKLLNSRRGDNAQPEIKVPDTISVDGELFRGDATAPVAIIEYGDIECPFCRYFKQSVYPQMFDEYIKTGKARFYYRDLPLPIHEHAMPAARAEHCAGEQGKFWEMHDSLFTEKPEAIGPGPGGRDRTLTQDSIDQRAAALGLDTAKLDACMASTRFADLIQRSSDEAAKMNIEGTPTFLIGTIGANGNIVKVNKPVVGALPFTAFKAVIDPLLVPAPATDAQAGQTMEKLQLDGAANHTVANH
ncbi:MAG TPA: thioredoxin domain-containing protein [Terriglobales bacterium]|jgi:protein-disulfide isomerase|nr:thioredoxin domain-containing protein [Terriglobales bacterium]